MTHGIRVAKPGYDVKTADPHQLIFSSEYQTLRVQQQVSGTITDSGCLTHTIAHNLGYKPLFIAHGDIGGSRYSILPETNVGNIITPGSTSIWATVDNTNLYIHVSSGFGHRIAYLEDAASQFPHSIGTYYGSGVLGDWTDLGGDSHAALRFVPIGVSQGVSVYRATLKWEIFNRNGGGDIFSRMYGLDQDNTAAFSSGDDPFNRPETTAQYLLHVGAGAGPGDIEEWNVTSIVNEIFARGGWSSANALGFKFWNDNTNGQTTDDNYISVSGNSYLDILPSNTLLNYKYTIFKDRIV